MCAATTENDPPSEISDDITGQLVYLSGAGLPRLSWIKGR